MIEAFIVDSAASLHTMSKNELTSVGKDTIRRSKEHTAITTANGKAESTEDSVRERFGRFFVMMLWERVASSGVFGVYYVQKWASLVNGKGRVSIVYSRWNGEKVQV